MNLLITSAAAPLAQRVATNLANVHDVRLTERNPVPGLADLAVSPLGSDLSTNLLVRGVDVIVHVAEPLPTEPDLAQLDYLTRCTYNLCMAAATEGVKRLIYVNTLAVMATHDPDYLVTEAWRPQPTVAMPVLAKHLGELTCREFAREGKLAVISLRLGTMEPTAATARAHEQGMWLDPRDAALAVERALTADVERRWSIFHIQHKSAAARFPIAAAEQQLGFAPQYNEYPVERADANAQATEGGTA